ncbi:hypothetical protein D9758_005629 [Tetrapyrgos nigripes]|uniref:glutathione transferase n=1 Tax=Tetrapyrgos nigripes TaxID=182062 RepID=A0A8H5GGP3_9AGAR|nr:hypothetical protein D9758_005629 [Tetrapyrgos nigripes]
MVLKLYGNPQSTCTKRVAAVLHEKKIPHELVTVDWSKIKEPEFVEKQPFGQVPYLDDDGFIVFESRAICRYIQAKFPDQGPKLVPSASDLKATALFEQAASVEAANFDQFAAKACFEGVIKGWYGAPKDQATFDQNISTLSGRLDGYERILSKQKYLAGDELTLADIFHLPYGEMLFQAGSDLLTSKGPNVARWWKDISSRPAWQAVKGAAPTGNVTF